MESKRKKNWVDICVSIVLYLLSIFVFIQSGTMQESIDNALNPSAWPRIICTLLCIAATVQLINALRGRITTKVTIENKTQVFSVMGLVLLYAIFLKSVGFIICTVFILLIILWIFRIRKAIQLIFIPILTTGLIYFLFHYLLRVPLPGGWLKFLA